jgi:hypothetical protein
MDDGIYNLQNVQLIAVTSTAPSECAEGDKYYNTLTKLIYTATGTNTWGQTGETPIADIFYIVLEEQTTYTYDGTDLISVGGSGSGTNIINEYSESTTDGYSANYVNNAIPTILDSLSSDSTTDAPSVHIVKDKFENMYKTASMTLESGTTMQSGYTNQISLIGEHLVSISTRFQKQASTANAYIKLATIPAGYRPTTQVLFSYVNENGTVLFCYIDASGGLYAFVADTSKTSYSIVVSYTI